jgi:hypothetical protein
MTWYVKELPAQIMTLSQIESEYELTIDRHALTPEGRDIYDLNPGDRQGPRYWLNEYADVAANDSR